MLSIRRFRACLFIVIAILVSMAGRAVGFTIDQEVRMGVETAREVEKEMPASKNETWQKDINEMGQRLVPYLNRKQIPYHFQIVQHDDELNAFALPGGYVYFTERMWRIMNPDERAAILAHEITHCDHRHAIDQMIKENQRAIWMLPLMVLSGGSAAGYLISIGNAVISQRYSRKMERDADESGLKLMKAAGFNPAGAVTSMKKLLSVESDNNRYEMSAMFASHPETKKRVDYLTSEALNLGAKPSELELKAVDDPACLGNVTKKLSEINMISARTNVSLAYGQKVLIKKLLWDDNAKALMPKTIAVATVLTPGKFPTLVFTTEGQYVFGDIMQGDGVYPDPASALQEPPIDTQKNP